MRIIAGKHRGCAIAAPAGQNIRPTADRAREGVFNVLAHGAALHGVLQGARVLDAFAGTGAMGLEALSRGAAHATFLDHSSAALGCVRANIRALNEASRAAVLNADPLSPPPCDAPVALAFLDPPYGRDIAADALEALAESGWFEGGAVVVVEHERDFDPPEGFQTFDARRYGRARFTFLRYAEPAEAA